jgi:transketolase
MNIDDIKIMSQKMRHRILELGNKVGKNGSHIGGGLSAVDILATLYGAVLKYDTKNPQNIMRDRFILSKGHAANSLFSALEYVGFISKDELDQFEVNGSPFFAHASRNVSKGIEFSGGSLSLGLSFAIGVALMCKRDKVDNHIYVLIGDGECNEGLIWESLMSASHFELTNLTVIVDFNSLQSDGFTKDIMNHSSLLDKFKSFGFNSMEIDGHDIEQIFSALQSKDILKPNAIIAKTVKGKGVTFMENNKDWHHGVLSDSLYEQAISDLSL